jgi:hypothetical protein
VSQSDDPPSIDALKRIQPRRIVKVRGIPIVPGVVRHLAIVLYSIERRSEAGPHNVVRSHKMNRSLVITECVCRRVWDINQFAGISGCIEHHAPRTIEHRLQCMLTIGLLPSRFATKGNCHEKQSTNNNEQAAHAILLLMKNTDFANKTCPSSEFAPIEQSFAGRVSKVLIFVQRNYFRIADHSGVL